jgi:predicted transcriptional regulator
MKFVSRSTNTSQKHLHSTLSARIPNLGSVTYVFLGRSNARLLLARFTDFLNISAPFAPSNFSENASAPSVLHSVVDTTNLDSIPKSGIIVQGEWLELLLNGQKTWELRTMKTNKRERVALAQSGTSLLLGDVTITGCIELDDVLVRANIHKHGVPLHRLAEYVRDDKKIFAWQIALPRRYKTPVPYKKDQGQMTWIDLKDQQSIFTKVHFMIAGEHDAGSNELSIK